MSQINDLKAHFSAPGTRLTAAEAWRKFGIMRLAARIGEMQSEGYVFDHESITAGKKKVAEYVLRCTPAMAVAAANKAGQAVAA